MAGNASLTTQGFNGPITTELWLQSIETSTNMEFDDNQVKRGMSFRPIRRSEMFVNFSAIWSLQRFGEMDDFQENIRKHFLLLAAGNQNSMTLLYYANNKVYNGWIDSVQKQYIRFQDVFIRNYRMNILLPNAEMNSAVVTQSAGFTPTSNFASLYGKDWYKVKKTDNIINKVLPTPQSFFPNQKNNRF